MIINKSSRVGCCLLNFSNSGPHNWRSCEKCWTVTVCNWCGGFRSRTNYGTCWVAWSGANCSSRRPTWSRSWSGWSTSTCIVAWSGANFSRWRSTCSRSWSGWSTRWRCCRDFKRIFEIKSSLIPKITNFFQVIGLDSAFGIIEIDVQPRTLRFSFLERQFGNLF